MVMATTATKRITAEAMPAMVLGLRQRTGPLTFQPQGWDPHHADSNTGLGPLAGGGPPQTEMWVSRWGCARLVWVDLRGPRFPEGQAACWPESGRRRCGVCAPVHDLTG